MYKNNIVVAINNGIHTRIAAMIVHKATEIKNKYGLDLYIKKWILKSLWLLVC